MQASSLFSCSTVLCADSIESVPGISGLFALATYQVDKDELSANSIRSDAETHSDSTARDEEDDDGSPTAGPAYTRRGTCTLRTVHPFGESDQVGCNVVEELETAAILDMKWSLANAPLAKGRVSADTTMKGPTPLATLGIADAQSNVSLHVLVPGSTSGPSDTATASSPETFRLQHAHTLKMNARDSLCLSLDWSDRTGGCPHAYSANQLASTAEMRSDPSLIVSQSDGTLAYIPSLAESIVADKPLEQALTNVRIHHRAGSRGSQGSQEESATPSDDEDSSDSDRSSSYERETAARTSHAALNGPFAGKPRGLETWQAHDHEAWIAAFDCWSAGSTVWSGGDDLQMKGWDLRTPNTQRGRQPIFSVTRGFDGGVTSMQSHHLRQHIWAVGSYDGRLRLFDARSPQRAVSETEVGGGIWRVKWHPTDAAVLLAGCMHDGFKILTLDALSEMRQDERLPRGQEMNITTRFDEHQSLAYGCDWDRGLSSQDVRRQVFSCSFYDASMHIWTS